MEGQFAMPRHCRAEQRLNAEVTTLFNGTKNTINIACYTNSPLIWKLIDYVIFLQMCHIICLIK